MQTFAHISCVFSLQIVYDFKKKDSMTLLKIYIYSVDLLLDSYLLCTLCRGPWG